MAEAELEARDRYSWASFRLLRGELLLRRAPAAAVAALADAAAVFRELGTEPQRLRAEATLNAVAGAAADRP